MTYDGQWVNDKRSGIGKMTYTNGSYYHGQFEENKKSGEGIFVFGNKDRYSGEWRDGKRNGKGVFIIQKTGVRLIGEWRNDEFSRGRWILKNGNFFEGRFDQNLPQGEGSWHIAGSDYKGQYTQVPSDVPDHYFPQIKGDFFQEQNLSHTVKWTTLQSTN